MTTAVDTIRVSISGKAWHSQCFGNDPHYRCDAPEMQALVERAQIVNCGKGHRVILTGNADDLEHLAHWFACDGQVWMSDCDQPESIAEGRACLDAAQRIRAAIKRAAGE